MSRDKTIRGKLGRKRETDIHVHKINSVTQRKQRRQVGLKSMSEKLQARLESDPSLPLERTSVVWH